MFSKAFQRKYALTDQGVKNTEKGVVWTVAANLVVMAGMGILYLLMGRFMDTLTAGAPLPAAAPVLALTVLFVLLSFLTHLQQYRATYGLVYDEVQATRLSMAERRQAGPGRPDRDAAGGRQPDGARLEPCAGLPLRRVHFHRHRGGLPGRL